MKIWDGNTGKWIEYENEELKKINKNNLSKNKKNKGATAPFNYFDDGYDFGDITKTGIQLGKNLVKTPENFKDGRQFGDVAKTVGASALDVGAGVVKGIMNFGENAIADPLQYGVAQISDWMGFDNFANAVRENAKQNGVEQTFAPIDKLTDRYTAIGTTGDQLSSGIGNVIAMGNASGLLKAKGLPSSVNVGKFAIPTTSIASGIGSGMTEAYNNGASDGEAWTYGALSGLAEGFSESLFGGLGKKFNLNVGEGGLDDFLVKKFTDKISNNTIKILAESGLKATGEGVEEILSGIGSAVSKKLTYLSEKDLETLIKDENLAEQFIMGTLTSLISQTPGTIQSVKTGTDLITGQPTNNQPLTLENMQQNVPYTVKSNKDNINPLGTNNTLNTPVLNENKQYAPYVPIKGKETENKKNSLVDQVTKQGEDIMKQEMQNYESITNDFKDYLIEEELDINEITDDNIDDFITNMYGDYEAYDNYNTEENAKGIGLNQKDYNKAKEIIESYVNENKIRKEEVEKNDYELWQDELNEILEKAKSVDENFYNDMKQQSDEYRDRHRLEYRIYEETQSRQAGNEVNDDFFKEHFSDYDGQSGTKLADGIMTSVKLKKGNNLAKLSFTEGEDVIWIDELYVKNKNQGYGTEIVETIKKYANENGKYVKAHKELSTAKGFWDKTLRNKNTETDINDVRYSTEDRTEFEENGKIEYNIFNQEKKDFSKSLKNKEWYYFYKLIDKHGIESKQNGTLNTLVVNNKIIRSQYIGNKPEVIEVFEAIETSNKIAEKYGLTTEDIIQDIYEIIEGENIDERTIKNCLEKYFNKGLLRRYNSNDNVFVGRNEETTRNVKPNISNIREKDDGRRNLSKFEQDRELENSSFFNDKNNNLNKEYEISETTNNPANNVMTMSEVKSMIDRVFNANGIYDFYDGKYKNADEWIKGEGIDDVSFYVENTEAINDKFLYKLDGLYEDYTIEDILQAYVDGTLKTEKKAYQPKRLDLSKEQEIKDNRFYAPRVATNDDKLYSKALERVTNTNRQEVYKARADFIINAHEIGYLDKVGVTAKQFIEKSKSWANYNKKAMDLSNSLNEGVASQNKWTGIENSSIVNTLSITDEQLNKMIKEIKGESQDYQRKYIVSTMLALDTHIDYKNLTFEFNKSKEINQNTTSGKRILGLYDNTIDTIKIGDGYQNTVAHEMGHYLDRQWGRELFGQNIELSEKRIISSKLDSLNPEQRQFVENFKGFIDDLENNSDIRNKYTMSSNEVFARFVARFVEWTKNQATNNRYGYENKYYEDNFTERQYKEFVKLLQEKSYLDTTGQTFTNVEFNKKKSKTDISNSRYSIEEKTNDQIQGLEDYTKPQIKNITTDYIRTALEYADIQADIVGMEIVGSRNRGTARLDSDLDIVVELTGEDLREDDLFNILNDDDEPLEINGIKVDINPILVERSGSLEEFMKRSNAYDKEQIKNSKSKYPDWINKIVPNEPYRKYRNYINDLMIQKQDETGLRITSDSSGVLVWQYGYASSLEKIKFEDTKKIAQQIYDLKATDNQGNELSKEQVKYFKDSKVRDEKGKLKIVYHGSENEFTEFDIDRAGARGSYYTTGFYFSTNKESAKVYATDKGKIYETYLNIKNPYIPTQDVINKDGTVTFAPSFYEDFEQKFKDKLPSDWNELNNVRKGTAARYILEDAGYDGVINGETYVAFRPNQIKNVDNTIPTESDDIRYSIEKDTTDNKGYHWGNLGKGRDTYHWNMTSSRRSTGHFGTGTYFLGSKDGNIGSTKEGRPLHEVDFSKYNLFKPENENEAYTLHEGLKALNYINNFNSDDFESLQLMLEKHGITGQKSYEAFVKARELYFSDEYQNASYDSELDSISTYFMKELGFNGIDVRGIERYDNGTYGSVIYDLDNTVAKSDEYSGDIRYSIEENDSLINAPKQDNKGRKLTKKQQEFYKNEDKKLLDENGNLKTLYHGTPYKGFTTFKGKLFCFSEDYKFAKEYGETKSFEQGLDADVEVKEVYVKAENIFDPSNPEHIKKLSDNLSDNINYWGNIWDKETLLNKLQRKDTLPPKWKPEQIENKKFGDYIGDDRHGYNTDMFVGVNDNNEIVYISQERELNKLSQTEKDMFQKQLLDGKEVIYTTYQTIFGDLTEKGIHNKINELQKQSEEYKKENGFENENIDYYIKRLKENLEWIKKDIFPSNNHKLIPRVATQESTELTDIDNWTYFETAMDNETRKDIVEIIQELGFDGINMYENGISNFAVFNPNQIKNVDNTNPTDSDDIRYSMVEDPLEISKLKKEDASTTPVAPFVKTEGGKEDGRSKHYSNLTRKSKFLNDKSVAAISNESGVKYYDKTTNQETLEKAKKELDNGGKSETLKWFNKDPKNADPTDIAKGWILLKQYQDKGDYDSVVQVAKKMRMMGTTTGKTLQMYAIMERLTPEGMVNYAQSELSEAYELMIKNKSKAWIDKHKSDFDLSPSEVKFIMDTMQEVSKMQDGYEKDVKLAEIQKLMTDKLPPEKGAGIKAWMRISMLFNPKTQVRNVLGNAVIAPVNAVGDAFASGIDKMIAKKTGVRTTGNINLSSYNEGFKKGLYKSYNDFKKGINTRNIEGNRFEIGQGKSFNDKTLIGHKLNQIDNLLSFMLDAGDRGFYEATFNNSINNQLILNNTTKVTPEMIDIATTEALQRTWQDNNEYTKFVLNTRKGLNKLLTVGNYGLGDILIPFAKTPANLTKAIIDYSPVGLVKAIIEGNNLKNAIETGQFTPQQQHKFVQDLGKAVAGTMLYVLGYALAKADITSGENDEDKDTANFMKNTLGISPYSIKIGNKSFTYDWAQPVAAPFAIMADLEAKENEDATLIEKAIDSFNTGFNIVIEQSFMQSIKTVLDNNDGIASGIQEAIMELPSRAIPTLSKQIADMVDGTQRQTFVYGKPVETAVNKVISKIPGASKALAPTVDTLGREIKKYGGKNNIYNVFINPASVSTENVSESAEEIYRLYKETGRTDLMPRVSPYYVNYNGEKIVLSNEDKSRFQKVSGDIIEKNVQKIINSSTYQSLTDEQKADVIQDIVNYSYNKARFEILGIEMSDTYQSVSDYEDAGGNISDYYLFQSNIDNTNSETKKQSISNYLINSNLSDKEISYLYNKYYSSDEKMDLLSKFNIPVKEYIKFNLQSFESDYNNKGKAISGSKQAKVFNYINSLKLSATQKAILMKMQYKSYKKYDNQILKYINSLNATKFEKASYAKKLGFDYYDDYLINQILRKSDISNEEKIKQLKALGFKYINGKIYK